MKPSDVAAKFDNRSSYKIVSYAEVGLPIFRITASVLIQEKKAFPPIDEFVMRAIDAGLSEIDEISGFLGLEVSVIKGAISNLIGDAQASQAPDGTVKLLEKGKRDLALEVLVRPTIETIVFDVDGLTREARWFGTQVREPRDLKALGTPEIRALPARRPEIHELQVEDVDRAFKLAAVRQVAGKISPKRVLRIREIFKARRLFYDGIALVFRSDTGDGVQMAFAIDGRISEEHELAFAEAGGVSKLGIEKSVLTNKDELSQQDILGEGAPPELQKALDQSSNAEKEMVTKYSVAKLKADASLKKLRRTAGPDERSSLEHNYQAALNEVQSLRGQLESVPVRNIPVYEHPDILHDALETAEKRLLIVSPWITKGVVDREFLLKLRNLLERGVQLTIIYGLNDRMDNQQNWNRNSAEEDLQKLSKEYFNFELVRVGDTHAKILIKDSDFYIVTSFNWLSFRGDPNRTFREEWGTRVAIKEQVDAYFSQLMQRFETG